MECTHKPSAEKDNTKEENINHELYEKALMAFNKTNQPQPVCCDVNLAKLRVVLDSNKDNYGRPFFVCSKLTDKCKYFEWGDEIILQRPRCYHNEVSKKCVVKRPGQNKGRLFFSCPCQQANLTQCRFFQWVDETQPLDKKKTPPPKQNNSDDIDDILHQFRFPKIPSSQYRIPKQKTPPENDENTCDGANDDDDDTIKIPSSQRHRKKQILLASDSEEEEQESPFLFYTRNQSGPSNGSFYCK
jgi:hypothetical protein